MLKTILEKIKTYGLLILSIICIVLLLLFAYYYHNYKNEKQERKRIESNYDILQSNDKSKQVDLTLDEFKKYYGKFDSIANELDIKSKYIKTIINNKYNITDTTIQTKLTVIDSIRNFEIKKFDIKKDCYTLTGQIDWTNDKISTKLDVNDNITTFLYEKRVKKWWNFNGHLPWGKKDFMAKTYSQCKKDTISVQNNIEIIKR